MIAKAKGAGFVCKKLGECTTYLKYPQYSDTCEKKSCLETKSNRRKFLSRNEICQYLSWYNVS